ncbi:hypothetical protein Mgrana_01716 [Meiothermus granaticius NBRC 107808]|uniref:Uncharacterized protein n=2 Tax=Meiothermus TaxID=65551 RepID=A0A399F8I1_9DEIN|nr:hypothetical protein Mgrana_01716 [Meiothermus granaticius NBRC 107808]
MNETRSRPTPSLHRFFTQLAHHKVMPTLHVHKTLWMMIAMLALGVGLAQSPTPAPSSPGGRTGMSDEMRKKLQAYRPVFDLTQSVALMNELDRQKGLAFSKAQAQKLLPLLKGLTTRSDLKPAEADKILSTIEDTILTDAQLQWMDTTRLAREEQLRQRTQAQGQQGQGGVRLPGAPPIGGLGGQRSGQTRQGGSRAGLFQALQEGKPFNPFKEGRAKENLEALIALLGQRAA